MSVNEFNPAQHKHHHDHACTDSAIQITTINTDQNPDIYVNGAIIARGEVVMVGERYGIRFTDVVDPEERAESVQ